MSKNTHKQSDDDSDLENEDEDHAEADGEDERPAGARARARGRAKTHAAHDDHDDHGHGHDHDEEDEVSDEDDAYWWAPHAVMSTLVLLGVLGFFGVFNKVLAPIAAKPPADAAAPASSGEAHAGAANTGHGAAPSPGPVGTSEAAAQFGARHLLVSYKGAMRAAPTITRTEEEAKARATEAMKKAKDKAKFEDLVKEYSDEPGAGARGGDLGTFRKGQMVPEFQAAVEKIKVGEVSDVIKTPFGYHVILRTK